MNTELPTLPASRLLPRAFVALCLPFLAASLSAQPANLQWEPLKEASVGGWTVSLSISPANANKVVVAGDLLGAASSSDGGQSWSQSRLDDGTSFKTWEMNDFTWLAGSSTGVWLGTVDGPHTSTDGGLAYSRRAIDNQVTGVSGPGTYLYYRYPVQKILVDPSNANRILAFGGSKRDLITTKAANYGAIWQSLDGGVTWYQGTPVTESIGVNGGSGTQVRTLLAPWRRLDPAKKTSEMNITAATYAAGASSQTIFVSVFNYGVYRSTNNGDTWATCNTGLPANADASFIVAHPTDPDTLWVVINGSGIYKTTNGGANWALANGTAPNTVAVTTGGSNIGWLAASRSSGGQTVLYYGSYASGRVYRSPDDGANWFRLPNPPATNVAIGGGNGTFDPCTLAVNPANANDIMVGGENILRATDGGATSASWQDVSSYRPEPLDSARRWRGRGFSGWVSNDFKWNPYAPDRAYFMAMDGGKVWSSDNNLLSWQKPATAVNGTALFPYFATNDITFGNDGLTNYIANGQNYNSADRNDGDFYNQPAKGIAKSVDGGLNYTYTNYPAAGSGKMAYSIYTLPDDTQRLWAVIGRRLYSSLDGGANWTAISILNGSSPDTLYELAAPTTNVSSDFVIYLSGKNGIYRSTDGTNFALLLGYPLTYDRPSNVDGGLTTITVDPNDRDVVYACTYGATTDGFWRFRPEDPATTAIERKWFRLAGTGLPGTKNIRNIRAVDVRPGDSNQIALITNFDNITDSSAATGVWLSSDAGATWYKRNDGIGVTRGKRIRYSPTGDRLVMASNGGGFYIAKTDGTALDYTQTLPADADTFVRDGTANQNDNYGANTTMLVKKDGLGYTRQAYLRFTAKDVGQTVLSATIRLHGQRAAGTVNPTLAIYPVSDVAWGETTATWANPPAGVGTTALATRVITATSQYYEWDVTAYVQQQLALGNVRLSFAVKSTTQVSAEVVSFASDEAAANKPELVITTDW